ncbi:acyltransferase family protein [Pseudonocardia sp. C8]|uniref:acyltransferase family protein n=1 Tax=Pseudonocardia sp. C8 TaxID=2762759 RepID=UPI0016429296|nr:acyltransferase family protein [Pseudonocardia sp. C8]MBC3190807.1 acyltransferase family protein [Pseudonocardia sp. C8]
MARHRAEPDRTAPTAPLGTVPDTYPPPRRPGDDRAPGRTVWVDAAKGLCIVLVVLHHAVMFLEPQGLVPGPLYLLNTAIASLRMPLFFLASGLFLASVLNRPWRVLLHKRVALFAWLYLLWTCLQYAVLAALPHGIAPPLATQTWERLLLSPLLPAPSMWFLYALALFSVAARLLRRVPAAVLLTATGVLSAVAAAGMLEFPSFAWGSMSRYAFFFVLGWHGRALVERLAAATSPLRVLVAAVVAAGAATASVVFGLRDIPGVAFGLNVVAVTGGVLAAAELARWRIGRVAIGLGRRTLPIYLANILVIGVLTTLLAGVRLPAPAQYVLVALVTATTVVLTLGVQRLLLTVRAGWLYDLPGRWAVRPTTS